MAGPHDAEMAAVNGRDLGYIEPLRRGDDRRVNGSEGKIVVDGDELGDPDWILGIDRLENEVSAREIAQEAHLGLPAQAAADQIGDLGDDEGRDYQRTGVGLQQLQAGGMMSVLSVDVGVEGTSVEDQGDGVISVRRISSMRSETSLRPLLPAPAAPRRRRCPAPRCSSSAVRVTAAIVTPRCSASWRKRASRLSGSLTVVRFIGMPAYQEGARLLRLGPQVLGDPLAARAALQSMRVPNRSRRRWPVRVRALRPACRPGRAISSRTCCSPGRSGAGRRDDVAR